VCAAQFGMVMTTADKGLQSLCDDSTTVQHDALKDLYKPYQVDIDTKIIPYAQKWMCSQQCACLKDGNEQPWLDISEDDLKTKYGRTNDQNDKDDTDGTVRLHFITADVVEVPFNSFSDCYYEWKNDWNGVKDDTPALWESSAQADF